MPPSANTIGDMKDITSSPGDRDESTNIASMDLPTSSFEIRDFPEILEKPESEAKDSDPNDRNDERPTANQPTFSNELMEDVPNSELEDVSESESEEELRMEEMDHNQSLNERREKSSKRRLQASEFLRLIEDRMTHLESELAILKADQVATENQNEDAEGKNSTLVQDDNEGIVRLPKKLLRQVQEQEWRVFGRSVERNTEDALIKVLKGAAGIGKNRRFPNGFMLPSVKRIVPGTSTQVSANVAVEETHAIPHRIRIFSSHIINMLEKFTSYEKEKKSFVTMIFPYETLIRYEAEIRDELSRMETHSPKIVRDAMVSPYGTTLHLDSQAMLLNQAWIRQFAERHSITRQDSEEIPREFSKGYKEDIVSRFLEIAEIRILVNFMDTRLMGVLDVRRQLQEGTLKTISFSNLCFLFNIGDIVLATEPGKQAFKVMSTSGGILLDRVKATYKLQSGHHNGLYTYNEYDVASPFVIDCYYLASNATIYGPVQQTFVIPYFSGSKPILLLPIYPERFHPDQQTLRESLIKRGRLFLNLVGDGQYYTHRIYQGWALTQRGDTEEIDSQVIIDLAATFQRNPQWAIKLGLDGPTPQDPREIDDCGALSHFHDSVEMCVMCQYDKFWPEKEIGMHRATEYIASIRDHLQNLQNVDDFCEREDELMLLPASTYGFALRSRKWVVMNVENISELLPSEEAFDDLVINPEHKTLVQALVKSHARGTYAPEKVSPEAREEYQADIIRGKGRGLIILLHGPPGVGKTSTAECVADLTRRPLFSITCGDIGTEPADVERNLDENFLLAHRWECVLLLDEADVFLQERDRQNLKRNSLVSVFLRTLEYYSGILILTTNREGALDEAFKSRIHISLHYEKLQRDDWLKIWENNMRRVSKHYEIDEKRLRKWAEQNFEALNWNGRQIRNAFQAATALAKFSTKEAESAAKDEKTTPAHVKLRVKDFKLVAAASVGFDEYLSSLHGMDTFEDIMRRERIRNDYHRSDNTRNKAYQPHSSSYIGSSHAQQNRQHPLDQTSSPYQYATPKKGSRSGGQRVAPRQQDQRSFDVDLMHDPQRNPVTGTTDYSSEDEDE